MSATKSDKPVDHIYKITSEPPPAPIPSVYPPSELDKKDGFIHLSTAAQVPRTADMFFAQATLLWIVKIKTDKLLHNRIEWGPTGCVSLYGDFGEIDVATVKKCQRQEAETWADFLQNEEWLE